MATRQHEDRLATIPTYRERIRVPAAKLSERLGSFSRRLEALQRLFVDAPRKPYELHELQCKHPKRLMPDEVLRTMIHEGIRAGHITREQVVAYRASQLIDDLSAFPGATNADDATYSALMHEVGDAVAAVTVHHGLPTAENHARMTKEALEAAATLQLHVASAAQKRTA